MKPRCRMKPNKNANENVINNQSDRSIRLSFGTTAPPKNRRRCSGKNNSQTTTLRQAAPIATSFIVYLTHIWLPNWRVDKMKSIVPHAAGAFKARGMFADLRQIVGVIPPLLPL